MQLEQPMVTTDSHSISYKNHTTLGKVGGDKMMNLQFMGNYPFKDLIMHKIAWYHNEDNPFCKVKK